MTQVRGNLIAGTARITFAAVVLAVAFLAPRYYGDPAPLGVPLPAVAYSYETEGVTPGDTSVNEGRIAPEWLEFLAAQPDGSPPLRYLFDSSGAAFEIWHPLGVEAVVFPPEQQQQTHTLAIALVKLDQPLYAIKYSLPRRNAGESVEQYVRRAASGLAAGGAEISGGTGELVVDGYRFTTMEYERDSEDTGLLHHFLFIGPYGDSALVIDFSARPIHKDHARNYVDKIIGSFKPMAELKRLYADEYQTAIE